MSKYLRVSLGVLSILLVVIGNSSGQNIYVNKKVNNQKECLPLDSIRSISVDGTYENLTSVEMYLARGTIGLGGMRFSSLKELSEFDVKRWLASERNSNGSSINSEIGSTGESYSKLKAHAGDRITVVARANEGKPIKTFTFFTCQ